MTELAGEELRISAAAIAMEMSLKICKCISLDSFKVQDIDLPFPHTLKRIPYLAAGPARAQRDDTINDMQKLVK